MPRAKSVSKLARQYAEMRYSKTSLNAATLDALGFLTSWLPLHATAIGNPDTTADYLRDVLTHNAEDARRLWDAPRRPDGKMLTRTRHAYRAALATAVAARRLLAELPR